MSFTIRDLKNYDEMVAVRHLQQEIWGFDDPNIGLYPPLLNTAVKNGGGLLGAFDNETGKMIAFLFSCLPCFGRTFPTAMSTRRLLTMKPAR